METIRFFKLFIIKVTVFTILICKSNYASAQSIEDVRRAIANEEYPTAIKIASSLQQSNPKNETYRYFLGLAYFRSALEDDVPVEQKRLLLSQAQENFNAGISIKKSNPFNYAGLGMVFGINGDQVKANEYLDKAFTIAEENNKLDVEFLTTLSSAYVDIYRNNKDAAVRRNAVNKATSMLSKAEAKEPNNVAVLVALGDLWAIQNVEELAVQKYNQAIKNDANAMRAYYALAQLYKKSKPAKYNEAKDALLSVIKIDPKFAPAYKELSEIYFKVSGDKVNFYAQAKEYAKKYRELIGNDLYARVRYAQLLYLTGSYEEAVTEFTALQKDTSSYNLKRLLAYSQVETKRYSEGKANLEELFKNLKPENIIYKDYRYYAIALANLGDLSGAEQNIAKAVELDPAQNELYKTLSDGFKEKKDYTNAIRFLELYLKKTSSFKDEFQLGWMYYAGLKDFNRSEVIFKKLASEKPDVADVQLYLARSSSRIDSTSKEGRAEPAYTAYLLLLEKQNKLGDEKLKDQIVEANNYLGYYHYVNSEQYKAKDPKKYMEELNLSLTHYTQALALKPEHPQAKQMEEFLKKSGAKVIEPLK